VLLRYSGLMMICQLGGAGRDVPAIRPWAGAAHPRPAVLLGVTVSTKEGAWEFRDPKPAFEDVPNDGCVWQSVSEFSFRLCRRL
jgi:hypothetical protein